MNRHTFEDAARMFRAGRISLAEFTKRVFAELEQVADSTTPRRDHANKDLCSPVDRGQDLEYDLQALGQFLELPKRSSDAHKGDFGKILIVAGSKSMPGASALAGMAVLRVGGGSATIATSQEAQPIVAGFSPALMTLALTSQGGQIVCRPDELLPLLENFDVVAMGPGLGRSAELQKLCQALYCKCDKPLVVDADGLNNLADAKIDFAKHSSPRIFTPHFGELRRIAQASDNIQLSDRNAGMKYASEFAARNQIIVLLKGHRSLITDGMSTVENPSGNSGMATAGAGDVLTGMIAGLLGQKLDPMSASVTGCFLHGLAGDLALRGRGALSLIATDLIESISTACSWLDAHKQAT